MKKRFWPILRCVALCFTLAASVGASRAQGLLMISNTNQPDDGVIGAVYATRAVFLPGSDAGGYELTGFSIVLGDNSSASHGPAHVILYGSNDQFNLDTNLSDFYLDLPPAPGFYYIAWPTNFYIPPQYSNTEDYYYHIVLVPASGDYLYVGYTESTATNYFYNNGWSFYPDASNINGWVGYYTLVNIYAEVLPAPVLYPIRLRDEAVLPDGSFQFGFTNSPGLSFSVYVNQIVGYCRSSQAGCLLNE